jgi:hypothetical protein
MSKKSFKYLHKGDGYSNAIFFVENEIAPFVESGGEPGNSGDELWIINKKIRITIEVYED